MESDCGLQSYQELFLTSLKKQEFLYSDNRILSMGDLGVRHVRELFIRDGHRI